MLSNLVSKSKTVLKGLLETLAVIGLFAFISAKGPEIHGTYIRHSVGSKVVKLTGDSSGGTGFFVKAPSGRTFILTNYHVCQLKNEAGYINVTKNGDTRSYPKRVIEMDSVHDLCLVESFYDVEGLSLASDVSVGETLGIVGHPKLYQLTLSRGQYIGEATISLMYDEQTGKLITPIVHKTTTKKGIKTMVKITQKN